MLYFLQWLLVSASLDILVKLLTDYELRSQDLSPDSVDVPGLGVVPASKPPGFTVLCLMLSDSKLFKTVSFQRFPCFL